MDEWTPTPEQADIIMAFALGNTIEYNGKPQMGSIMSRLGTQFDLKSVGRYLPKYVNAAMAEAITMYDEEGREDSISYLARLGPVGMETVARIRKMEGPKEKREQVLKELPNAETGNFRVRFAPNPNAPLTLGHSRGVTINRAYADKYGGDFILRFDDTGMGTKPPLLAAYQMIPEDIEWLTGDMPDEIYYASDRLDIYYEWAYQLINLGGAYVDTLSREEAAELKAAGLPNPNRDRSVEENRALFEDMIEGRFQPGEAVLRIRSDPNAPDPALRDFVLFRMQLGGHPRKPDDVCWPVLDFQSAIDDYELEITHIIRGIDLQASTRKQQILYEFFGWDYPEVEYWGRVNVLDENEVPISFSSSAYAKGIKDGVYSGWDDPELFTVRGMRARGYRPEAIEQWWKDMGMKRGNIDAPLTTLNSLNRQMTGGKKALEAETFEAPSDEPENWTESDCIICARPFDVANRFRFEEVKNAYDSAVKSARTAAYTDLADLEGVAIDTTDDLRDFIELVPEETRQQIDSVATSTLKSKSNPYGVRKTGRTLAYWWLVVVPWVDEEGNQWNGFHTDALNAYMAQYLVEGKKRSNVADKVEAFLRDILVPEGTIRARVMDIQDFGLSPPTRRIPAFSPKFIEEFEANGVSVDPPPPMGVGTGCTVCGRPFDFSDLARALSRKYYEDSDGGAIDMRSRKTLPEDKAISRTAVNVAGQYLFKYEGHALDEYFRQVKSPSPKVINLLRLALVPSITVNQEMFQLVKNLQFGDEPQIQFPTAFIDEFQSEEVFSAESVLEQVKSAESLESASKTLRAYTGEGMMADNMKYLDSIISYDYGSNQNAEYELYGAPTVADVQKFAEGLLNIHRFLGE
jgi:glutamyl-tRNA synthetase